MHINRLFVLFFTCLPLLACSANESTLSIENDTHIDYLKADKNLNATYSELRKSLKPELKTDLLRMQRAWIQYRDKKCNDEFPLGKNYGSIAKTENMLCKTIATNLQTEELNRLSKVNLSINKISNRSSDYQLLICQLFDKKNYQDCTIRIKQNDLIISNLGSQPNGFSKPEPERTSLPFTEKQVNPNDPSKQLKSEFPLSEKNYISSINELFGGSSDYGFYVLPNKSQTKVFIGFGLFEDESEEYVSADNPDGMFTEQENYLITVNNGDLDYVRLSERFHIGKQYKDIYTIKEDTKAYFTILPSGKIQPLK